MFGEGTDGQKCPDTEKVPGGAQQDWAEEKHKKVRLGG